MFDTDAADLSRNEEPATIDDLLHSNNNDGEESGSSSIVSAVLPVMASGFAPNPSSIDRTYTHRTFTLPAASESTQSHQQVFTLQCHACGVVVLSLGAKHSLVQQHAASPLRIRIDWLVNGKDRSDVKLSGKRKRGAVQTSESTVLCQIHAQSNTDSSSTMQLGDSATPTAASQCFSVVACCRGQLIEVNDSLNASPEWCASRSADSGYIAVLLLTQRELRRVVTEYAALETSVSV